MVGASIPDEGNGSSSISPVYSGGSYLRSPVSSGGSDLRSPVYSGGSDLRSPVSSGGSVLRSPVSAGGSLLRSPVSSGDGAKRVCTEDKRLSTTLFNLNVLDCPICFEALTIPIFQCDNGHLACSCCCPKLNNKCPSCALPVGHIRNRAMETVLESIFVPCRNAAFGCTKKFTYGIESEHEEECRYAPCSCPVPDCDYTGSYYKIERHSFVEHRDIWESNCFRFGISFDVRMNISDKLLTWTETSAGLLFPVQCFREPCGVYVSVSCIAPPAPTVGRFSYDISYTVDGQTVIYKSVEAKKILQCDNGHLACSSCSPKLRNKCPACALPVGHSRCRAMETVLESTFVPCRNAVLGCTKKFTYGKESAHEKECNFSPCSCPVQGCDYTGSIYNIYDHFFPKHVDILMLNWFSCGRSISVRMNIGDKIQISTDVFTRLMFPVQCFRKPYGVYVTVSCIAPPSPEVNKFAYDISYTTADGHTVVYKSPELKRVLKVSYEIPQDNFMFIPHNLLRGESLELKLCVTELNQV